MWLSMCCVDCRSSALQNIGTKAELCTRDALVPLYDARIEDLGPGDHVRVQCLACGYDELIQQSSFLQGLGFAPDTRIMVERRFRCRECDAKGKAVVLVNWAADQ